MRSTKPPVEKVRCWTIPALTKDSEPKAPPAADWSSTDPTHVRYGYALIDIQDLAAAAARRDRWNTARDVADRVDTARFAIIEHLYAAESRPTPQDLTRSAMRAADDYVRTEMQAHGIQRAERGGGVLPSFERYWWTVAAATSSPEQRVVESLALHQILPRLTARQLEAVVLLAELGDYQASAKAMGITGATFNVTIANARRRFFTYWHEGEAPSRPWGTDRRVGSRSATTAPANRRRPATIAVRRRAIRTPGGAE